MAFEDLRERLKESASEALAKIQETSAYNTLRERYESQTPPVQKALVWGGGVLAVLLLYYMLPYAYLSSSSQTLTAFEENRELIQGLLRASHSAKEPAPLPPPQTPDSMRVAIEGTIRQQGLIAEQIGDMIAIPIDEIRGLAPPGVVVNGLAVTLRKLNVSQLIELGNAVQNTGTPGNKLIGVDVFQSAGTTHYYDMILRVVNFGLEPFDTGAGAEPPPSKRSPPRKGKNADTETE